MVRIGLTQRISSHLGTRGGNGSGEHSRSGSPARQPGVTDSKPLILKVNVIRVTQFQVLYQLYMLISNDRVVIWQPRTEEEQVIQ